MGDCIGCIYWRYLQYRERGPCACHYILDTGKMRGCPTGKECTKRKEGEVKNMIISEKGEFIYGQC